jgi:adenylate kinase family enzyme
MCPFPYKRIVIIGTTSSGKSTLAERLAERLDLACVDLDALHWEPGWQGAPLEVFRARVLEATKSGRWVVAGNYSSVRDLLWSQAEAVIWLDYSFGVIFGRLWKRTWRRWWHQELLWGTNRENMWNHLKLWSDDSLFKWLFKTYWRRKREFPEQLAQPEHKHLKLFRFKAPQETENWLAGINAVTQ